MNIRQLPRGPFADFLHRHHGPQPAAPRFAMGLGAIFSVEGLRHPDDAAADLPGAGDARTDARLVGELLTFAVAQGLEILPVHAVPARLEQGGDPFVAFAFSGAARDIHDLALPFFARRNAPLTVFLGDAEAPCWRAALRRLVQRAPALEVRIGTARAHYGLLTPRDRSHAVQRLEADLTLLPRAERLPAVAAIAEAHAVDIADHDAFSTEQLTAFGAHSGVSLGFDASRYDLAERGFDEAGELLAAQAARLAALRGDAPAVVAFGADRLPRDQAVATAAGFACGLIPVEGALWPEHARLPLALPSIALRDDPAILSRALMLGGGAAVPRRAASR